MTLKNFHLDSVLSLLFTLLVEEPFVITSLEPFELLRFLLLPHDMTTLLATRSIRKVDRKLHHAGTVSFWLALASFYSTTPRRKC